MHAQQPTLRSPLGLALHHTVNLRFEIRSDGALAGLAGFEGRSDGAFELYYSIEKPYRRRGFAREAAGLLCNWLFEEVAPPKITAVVNKENVGSQRVLESCGFRVYKVAAALLYFEKPNPALPGS